MRVISCNSWTDSSFFSRRATMRSRVGSDKARNDFKMAGMKIKVDAYSKALYLPIKIRQYVFMQLSIMNKNFIFSSESVGEGHPDKVCDTISDAVLDAHLAQDPRSRVACETYAKSNMVIVGGEITSQASGPHQ